MGAAMRQMHLGVFVLGTGNHSAGWRYEGAATSNNELAVIEEIGRIAERGKFDLLFISDGLVMDPGDHPSFLCRFEPTTLISVLSASTSHIGLGATVSTSFNEPYNVARIFASIDHLSQGRAAWNVVTSSPGAGPRSISAATAHMEHELRYEVAQEFVDVVKGLWDCWDDGAIVADKATGAIHRSGQGAPARPQGPVLPGQGPDQHGALPAGPSGHHPGRRLALRARARGAHRRCRVFGGPGTWQRQGGLSPI